MHNASRDMLHVFLGGILLFLLFLYSFTFPFPVQVQGMNNDLRSLFDLFLSLLYRRMSFSKALT